MGSKSTFCLFKTGRMLAAKKYKAAMILLALLIIPCVARADTNIDNCTILNQTGETYTLTQNITDSAFDICLQVNNNSITLDCQGYLVDSDAMDGYYGVDITAKSFNNVTVKNCIITDWLEAGIYAIGLNDSNIYNNTINTNHIGFEFDSSFNNSIYNSTINSNNEAGIYGGYNSSIYNNNIAFNGNSGLYLSSNNLVYNNTFDDNGDVGFWDNIDLSGENNSVYFNRILNVTNGDSGINTATTAKDNLIYNNYFNNSINVYLSNASNPQNFNTTQQAGTRIYSSGTEIGGNYWTNSTANGYSDTCTDLLQDGFCDDPYDVEADVACAAVADGLPACGNNTDWLPLSAFYEEPACVQSWNCTAWGECIRGYQTRECTDLNECQNETGRPAQSQACLKGLPNATYNISSDCCPISTFYCTDNETLVQLWNTSQGVSWAVEDCEFGCDNTTETCMPPSGQQNLLLFGVIVAFCVLGALFWRWSRR